MGVSRSTTELYLTVLDIIGCTRDRSTSHLFSLPLLCGSSCVNRPDAVWYFARRAERLTGTLRRRRACACPPPPSSPPLGPLWKPFPAEPSPRARVPPGCVSLALPPAAEADCHRTNRNEMQIVRALWFRFGHVAMSISETSRSAR